MFQEQLQQILDDIINRSGTEVSAAIYYRGKCAAAAAAGGGDVRAKATDRFNIGSISKIYCAAAVMKLVEEKRITLDTKICQVLPQFQMADRRYRDITFRMCLNHSSGLPGTGMRLAFQAEFLYDEFKEAFFDYLSRGKLKADPGSFSVYCNDGFDLAAFAIEEITGRSYSSYLRRAILEPLGAGSTGCGIEVLPGKLVRQNGCPLEYLACLGSGGIVTNLTDCAKFGAMFAVESSSQMTCPQGKSRTGNTQSLYYGLGWDTVSLSTEHYDFGPGTLGKSGGTSQFASYLLVSPRYELSIGISATKDTGIVPLEVASEIGAAFLKSEGADIVKPQMPSEHVRPRAMDGLYFGNRGLYRVCSREMDFAVDEFTPDGWKKFAETGEDFSFQEREGAVDLMMRWQGADLVLAQKVESKETLPVRKKTAWEQRIGKSYLIYNGHPDDLDIGDMVNGITIYRPETAESEFEKNIILFCAKEEGGFRMMPAMPAGDFETDYVLDGEGGSGCRDTFTPFVEIESGIEILYDCGVRYIDTDSLPKLASQTVTSREPQKNPAFRTDAGYRITACKPQHVKILLFDEELYPYYDERRDCVFPMTKKGYIVFLAKEPFSAEVSYEQNEIGEEDEYRSN